MARERMLPRDSARVEALRRRAKLVRLRTDLKFHLARGERVAEIRDALEVVDGQLAVVNELIVREGWQT